MNIVDVYTFHALPHLSTIWLMKEVVLPLCRHIFRSRCDDLNLRVIILLYQTRIYFNRVVYISVIPRIKMWDSEKDGWSSSYGAKCQVNVVVLFDNWIAFTLYLAKHVSWQNDVAIFTLFPPYILSLFDIHPQLPNALLR